MKHAIAFCFSILLTTAFIAQVPAAFNYQGVARDLSGNPIPNQQISLRIAILEEAVDGNVKYQEVHNPVTNNLGLFNVAIGLGDPVSGAFGEIAWEKYSHFIQVDIDAQGGSNYEFLGTSPLLSVPYALYASNGSKWDDATLVGPDAIIHNGKVLIGKEDATMVSLLDIWQDDEDLGPFTNTQIANFNRSHGGSSVGFGIFGYPESDLVYDHLRGSIMLYASEETKDLILCADNTNGSIRFVTRDWYNASNERMRIDRYGNVGVGTISPASRLQIKDGDIYIEDVNKGVIMKSPNGGCWRMTVSDIGEPVFTPISCPD